MAKVLGVSESKALQALKELQDQYNLPDSGVILIQNNDEWQLVSNPNNRAAAENFLKAEVSGDLTRPQLETLTVISYCGPITKPELEQLRGVNCSLILRNLMLRGLAEEVETEINILPKYQVTMQYLRHLGLMTVKDLPNYDELHKHEHITRALEDNPT